MKLFLIHDDVEEFLITAADANDAFMVIEEEVGKDQADELVGSYLTEYPDDFELKPQETAGVIAGRGRRLVEWNVLRGLNPPRIPKPLKN